MSQSPDKSSNTSLPKEAEERFCTPVRNTGRHPFKLPTPEAAPQTTQQGSSAPLFPSISHLNDQELLDFKRMIELQLLSQASSHPQPSGPSSGQEDGSWNATVSSTPYNPGAADDYAYETQVTREDFDPYLKFVANQKTVELDPYLSTVLHVSDLPQGDLKVLEGIANSDEFLCLRAAYCVPMKDETERYPHFAEFSFSFIHDPLTFLRVVLASTHLSLSDWGYYAQAAPQRLSVSTQALEPKIPDCNIFKGRTIKLGDYNYILQEVLVFPHGLVSRGTWIILAKCVQTGALVVIKISTPATSRTEEWKIVEKAERVARSDMKSHGWVLKHLPKIHSYGTIASRSFGSLFGYGFEEREGRYLVMERLHRITELTDPFEFVGAFKDTVQCHQWLVVHPKIMHRDVSVNNLIYRKDDDGKIYGVLNDLDLAVFIDEHPEPSSKHRTGTKPFMARHLLNPKSAYPSDNKHYARYDLESFVYVFGWILGRFEKGKQIVNPPYDVWADERWETIEAHKNTWLTSPLSQTSTPTYQSVVPVLRALCAHVADGMDVFRKALVASGDDLEAMKAPDGQPFDYATLQGHVTYTNIFAALDAVKPQSSA